MLDEADHARVSAAIAAAEGKSNGEILAIVADKSDSYHDVALHYAVLVAFLTLGFFAAFPSWLDFWWAQLLVWQQPTQRGLLTLLFALVLAKFLGTLLIMRWPRLRFALTPTATRTRRVRRRAVMLFKAAAERRTLGRTGVLVYLSMGEHRAEIIGDEAITAVTEPGCWGEAMRVLLEGVRAGKPADGIVAAIGQVGTVLERHFPRTEDDVNEIPDKLIEL